MVIPSLRKNKSGINKRYLSVATLLCRIGNVKVLYTQSKNKGNFFNYKHE